MQLQKGEKQVLKNIKQFIFSVSNIVSFSSLNYICERIEVLHLDNQRSFPAIG